MFQPATKKQSYLRLALIGPAGSGKTYTALSIAAGIEPMGKIAVLDTETGSASKYSDVFAFDVAELHGDFAPQKYIEAIAAAEKANYDVLVIDSLSHAWMGIGGALEMVDNATRRSKSGNSYAAWREVTPHHNRLVEAMLSARLHIITTMRTKTEYVVEADSRGKQAPRKIGLAPVQRDGLDYEFDVVLDVDRDHVATVDKTRCSAIADKAYACIAPDSECVTALREWLRGVPIRQDAPAPTPRPCPMPIANDVPAPTPTAPEDAPKTAALKAAWAIAKQWGADPSDWSALFRNQGYDTSAAAPMDYVLRLKTRLENKADLLAQLPADYDGIRNFLAARGGILNAHIDDIRAAVTDAVNRIGAAS